jgi:GNAT superfamily N-acetyltransferase
MTIAEDFPAELSAPRPRPLTHAEAARLHRELRTTPNILGYTVAELRRWQNVLVQEIAGASAGVCLSVDLADGWTEVSVLYVLPEFRGRGIGRRLFTVAVDLARGRGRHVYALSRNPQVVSWMRDASMTVSGGFRQAPGPVRAHMRRHMLHPYRGWEALRKWPHIRRCAPLLQGVLVAEGDVGGTAAQSGTGS